jgi:hypothetical protein
MYYKENGMQGKVVSVHYEFEHYVIPGLLQAV